MGSKDSKDSCARPADRAAVGDIWQEQDPRQPRFVRIVRVGHGSAFIQAVEQDGANEWVPARNDATGREAPVREAQLKRFNGQRSGYKLYARNGKCV